MIGARPVWGTGTGSAGAEAWIVTERAVWKGAANEVGIVAAAANEALGGAQTLAAAAAAAAAQAPAGVQAVAGTVAWTSAVTEVGFVVADGAGVAVQWTGCVKVQACALRALAHCTSLSLASQAPAHHPLFLAPWTSSSSSSLSWRLQAQMQHQCCLCSCLCPVHNHVCM